MISFEKLLNNLETWFKSKHVKNFSFAWVDLHKAPESKLLNLSQEKQSYILKYICEKSNFNYYIYCVDYTENDEQRLIDYSDFLKWKSKNINTILLSKILKEQLYFGEYKKYYFDELDLMPFANLTDSQVFGLLDFINSGNKINSYPVSSKLEWLYNQEQKYKIISSNQDPAKSIRWGTFSREERELIARYYSLFRDRKHKIEKQNIFYE